MQGMPNIFGVKRALILWITSANYIFFLEMKLCGKDLLQDFLYQIGKSDTNFI